MRLRPGFTVDFFNQLGRAHLPEHLGIVVTKVEEGLVCTEMPLQQSLLAPNNFLHAGAVVALADTTAGYACLAHLPEDGESFTTIELKANFMGTARAGVVRCEAVPVHLGSTTQVWDASVFADGRDRPIAVFRCTQLVLYRRGGVGSTEPPGRRRLDEAGQEAEVPASPAPEQDRRGGAGSAGAGAGP